MREEGNGVKSFFSPAFTCSAVQRRESLFHTIQILDVFQQITENFGFISKYWSYKLAVAATASIDCKISNSKANG